MRCFQIDSAGATALHGCFPARHADAPFVARFQTGKIIFGPRRDEIVAIKHRKIQEVAIDQNTNGMQPDIFRTGAAVAIAIEAGAWLATAAFEFVAQDICEVSHALILHRQTRFRRGLLVSKGDIS